MHHFRGKATTTVQYRYNFLNFRSFHLCERLQSAKILVDKPKSRTKLSSPMISIRISLRFTVRALGDLPGSRAFLSASLSTLTAELDHRRVGQPGACRFRAAYVALNPLRRVRNLFQRSQKKMHPTPPTSSSPHCRLGRKDRYALSGSGRVPSLQQFGAISSPRCRGFRAFARAEKDTPRSLCSTATHWET